MDAVRNPYSPGAGFRPPALTGRDSEREAFRVLLQRLRAGRPQKSMLITGLRGVGKTVLLNTFERIARDAGFATALKEITHETDFRAVMAQQVQRALVTVSPLDKLRAAGKRALGILKAFKIRLPDGGAEISVDVEAVLGIGDSGNLEEDLADLLVALGEAAAENQTGVVFLLDEVQFLERPELEALISALHRCSQRSVPVTLVGAGLPQLPQLAGEAKSYAERLFNFPRIDSLGAAAAGDALQLPAEEQGAHYEDDAIDHIFRFTEGYPYFLQEFGKAAWDFAVGPTITLADVREAERWVREELDGNFFRVRVERCTPTELAYMSAMASLGDGPYRSGEIATALEKPGAPNVAPTRAQLIRKGLIFSPDHGQNQFTVPQFADFMRRQYPDWRVIVSS